MHVFRRGFTPQSPMLVAPYVQSVRGLTATQSSRGNDGQLLNQPCRRTTTSHADCRRLHQRVDAARTRHASCTISHSSRPISMRRVAATAVRSIHFVQSYSASGVEASRKNHGAATSPMPNHVASPGKLACGARPPNLVVQIIRHTHATPLDQGHKLLKGGVQSKIFLHCRPNSRVP